MKPAATRRVLTLNTNDGAGGAARAAYRLHRGLLAAGCAARLLVQDKQGDDRSVQRLAESRPGRVLAALRPWVDLWPLAAYRDREKVPWSCNVMPGSGRLRRAAADFRPEIVHLHWVGGGFVPVSAVRGLGCPVVWTLHDMWPFTGGCHYDDGCGRYREQCGACPQLRSASPADLSHRLWRRKAAAWTGTDLTLICPSRWMAECAGNSSLFAGRRIEVIPNGLDLNRFKPLDRGYCRQLLGVPADRRLILFGAMAATDDRKKGFAYLEPALRAFAHSHQASGCELAVFGASAPERPPDFGLPTRYLGRLHDEMSLAVLYAAADVMLVPSTQDNLPNTVMEAMACGTPVVAFSVGGIPDMIDHEHNGYLARAFDAEHLAAGIAWVLADAGRWHTLAHRARAKVMACYDLPAITARHLALYEELVAGAAESRGRP